MKLVTMRIRLSLLSVLFLTIINSSICGQVQISGKFKPIGKDTVILVYKPISSFYNKSFALKDGIKIKSGNFSTSLTIDAPGFICFQGKSFPKTIFYVEPDEQIEILFFKDETGRTKVKFSGNNEIANNILVNNSPLDNQSFLQFRLPEMFQTESADSFYEIMNRELEISTKPFKNQIEKKRITQRCYQAMMGETEQAMLYWVSMYLKDFQMPDNELPYVTKLNHDEVKKLTNMLYLKYDPYKNKYLSATRTQQNQLTKSKLIEKGVLENNKEVTPTWSEFADDFTNVASGLSAIDYAPDSVQMSFIGNTLLSALTYQSVSDKIFNLAFSIYQTKFPSSPFNPLIKDHSYFNRDQTHLADNATVGDALFMDKKFSDSLLRKEFVNVDQIANLQDLIKINFSGKIVFVDFWATWCSPCIAEFQNESSLRVFLEENQIVTLYVSIDNPSETSKWENAIDKYKLSGYHCLVNKDIRESLDKWFAGIPRYMLFDSTGELLDDNLPKPSTKTELYTRITQLLR